MTTPAPAAAKPAPPTPTRIPGIALAIVAALALAYTSFSNRWAVLVDPDVDGGFGLRAWETCPAHGACVSQSNASFVEDVNRELDEARAEARQDPNMDPAALDDAHAASSAFAPSGWAAAIALWLASASLLVCAALAAARKFVFRPIAPTSFALFALALGLVGGCVFIALNPGRPVYRVGPTFWIFGGAEIAGIVATLILARLRPYEPEWDDPQPVTDDPDRW